MALVAERDVKLTGKLEALAAEPGKAPRFSMLAYTGAEIDRFYGKAIGDLSGIKCPEKLPILLNHDEDAVVGYADKAELTGQGLVLSGPLLTEEPAGKRVHNLSKSGFPLTASIGIHIDRVEHVDEGKTAKCNGRDVAGPVAIWRSGSLFESSVVTANPADKNTATAALKQEQTMTPDEFAKAHPDVVRVWKEEAVKADHARLAELLKAIPGREGFVLEQFAAGADVKTAKAALCDVVLAEKLTTPPPAPAGNPILDALKAKANHPGLGFDGNARQQTGQPDLKGLPPEERAKAEFARDPNLAQITTLQSLTAFYKAEARGQVGNNAVNRAAAAMNGTA